MTVEMSLSPKQELAELKRSAQQSGASLVELELDPERKLLEAATLEGISADRRSRARALSAELWRRQGLLEDLLARAEQLARPRRAAELAALLDGPSIDIGPAAVEPAARSLLGAHGQVRSPAELLAEMTEMFDEVRGVFGLFARTWEELIPQLESVRNLAQTTTMLADADAPDDRGRLDAPLAAVASLARAVARDPLSVRDDAVAALSEELESLRLEYQRSAELRVAFPAALAAARTQLSTLNDAHAEARAAREELFVKIARPSGPPLATLDESLESELGRIGQLAEDRAWVDARRALDALCARIAAAVLDTRRCTEAYRSPIDARNQYRALLKAYQVKASRVGLIEDPDVAAIFRAAEAELHSAPTDLANAARLVRSYQEALSGPSRRDVEP
jgi:hypothetical protein